jgi:catechol 2,3-dioxygenase-like lactoylglutathione lyase family enzyme
VNHFHFASARAGETISFYETYFGFRERRTLGKTHVLMNDSRFLLAIDETEACGPALNGAHLGFSLANPEAVKALFHKMARAGVTLSGNLLEPSARATHFYCVDPSGNRVEVGWFDL